MAGKTLNIGQAVEKERFEPKLKGQQDSKPVKEKLERIKVTFYLNPEDNLILEETKLILKKQGHDKDKSELIREAIGLLSERYTSKTASQQ
jgi:hypothetical protein